MTVNKKQNKNSLKQLKKHKHCKEIQHKQNRFPGSKNPNGTEKQFKYTTEENFSEKCNT